MIENNWLKEKYQ